MSRRAVAAIVLFAWILALGWQVKRVYFPAGAERFALGVRLLPPGVAYYAVYRGAERAGWAQTEIDTLSAATGVYVRDRLVLDSADGTGEEAISEAWYGPTLALDSLAHRSIGPSDTLRVRGTVAGDTAVWLRLDAAGAETWTRLAVGGPPVLASGWPLRLAAEGKAETGDAYVVEIVDPASATARRAHLRILEVRSIAFPDSADTDSLTGEWFPARWDTVRAWRVVETVGRVELEAWVDEDGRYVNVELPGGLLLERTAFELAFFTRGQEQVPE